MTSRDWRVGCPAVCAAVIVLTVAACGRGPAQPVERLDVQVTVLPDGSLDVHEEFAIRVGPDGGAGFERVVDAPRADRVHFTGASIGNRTLEEGDGLEVTQGRRLRVRWDLPPGSGASHVLALDYRVEGAIELQGAVGLLRWRALPAERALEIDASRLVLRLPGRAPVEGTMGIAEAGWTVARTEDGIAADRAPVGRSESATLMAEFPVDGAGLSEPDWQFNAARRAEFVPAFVAGGLFILTIGAGILWIVRFQHPRRPRPAPVDPERAAAAAGLRTGGAVMLVFGIAVAAVAALFTEQFGRMLFAIPASIALVGLALIVASRRL